jgi:hypothetical protein
MKQLIKKLTKEDIVKRLMKDLDGETKEWYKDEKFWVVNQEKWTITDLFIRQWLNNGSNGFGMKRVKQNYEWLVSIKTELIEFNMVSREGFNNSGFPLWSYYDF